MDEQHRAQEPQSWGPRNSQGSAPPQGPPPNSPYQGETPPRPKKRHRVFLWLFLAVQILFLIWVITGAASGSGTPEECQGRTGDALKLCEDASDVGTTIGVGLIIGLWAAVDVILGFSYVVYRLASRRT
ncbi:OPT/YSL family transporter [Streptomyces sp. DSM 40750]|uniref:OPT/YSL family transporter n=1 Tax=Streptomyces sp. DSM 40750 TaxID=2801030 RepID=UPI00214C2719|nr:OPT/YSL family transporter [Streptomyces sp. DSM 40750]UUU23789.1 OPT/YSL family transporter [Streptomyces sp. DSM 40750]